MYILSSDCADDSFFVFVLCFDPEALFFILFRFAVVGDGPYLCAVTEFFLLNGGSRVPESLGRFFDRHSLLKCPIESHLKHFLSFAGHRVM